MTDSKRQIMTTSPPSRDVTAQAVVACVKPSMVARTLPLLALVHHGSGPCLVSSFRSLPLGDDPAFRRRPTKNPLQSSPSHEASIEVRDWRVGEEAAIQSLLLQGFPAYASSSPASPLSSSAPLFDPEGPLEVDCGSRQALQATYDDADSDGGSFLVAVTSANDGSAVVGTAGLILGTQVRYFASGSSSLSAPSKVTGAVRRVCCTSPAAAGRASSSYLSSLSSVVADDQSRILRCLLLEVEARAKRMGATELILLAYPPYYSTNEVARPTPQLVSDLGYQAQAQLDVPMRGGGSIETIQQYYKVLGRDGSTSWKREAGVARAAETAGTNVGGFNARAAAVATVALSLILGLALGVASLLGLDVSPVASSSGDNRGVGTPLSREEMQRLLQDETLQRTDLDGLVETGSSASHTAIRAWEELSDEERREEAALLKIIQGQDVRIRSP